jgi:hypothetical protein
LGFVYVIYFYRKLVEAKRGETERQLSSNVEDLKITGIDMEGVFGGEEQ